MCLLLFRLLLIVDEQLDMDSFIHLSEDDLKEIGFKMGPRKLIRTWISMQSPSTRFGLDLSPSVIDSPHQNSVTPTANSLSETPVSASSVNRPFLVIHSFLVILLIFEPN